MQSEVVDIIIRHRRENLKKCSLRGLESRSDLRFFTYPRDQVPDLTGFLLLSFEGKPLSTEDRDRGIVVVDGTWKLAQAIYKNTPSLHQLEKRSLPLHFITAYPRRQDDCDDPDRGLASVEALFIARTLQGRDSSGLLDHYHWKEKFLTLNAGL
ncbi:DTW domain-containing protein [Estrella lausannensis]|uniref:Uncharacterized protein n=1 Tax=Estrella lausannensis TaxID=483423 RepID=A0A0H5E593_9BACT|nr:DTW domain-containing protein [Estrella lausannensis]CRX38410.1 Conserved hypothetical protein [Estrella lausannensis]